MHKKQPLLLVLAVLCLIGSGCASTKADPEAWIAERPPVGYTVLTDSVEADPVLAALVAPYRAQLEEAVSAVVGEATADLVKGRTIEENSLGNFAADAMLAVVQTHTDAPVQIAVTNNGGLRIPSINAGPVAVGKLFELMPFENMMTVLTLSSVQVDSLAQQMARVRGEPVAGLSFLMRASTGRAFNIEVGGEPLSADRQYRLVTSDYLANGGGAMPALWTPMAREDLNLLLRDAFIEYVRTQKTITPVLDGRVRIQP